MPNIVEIKLEINTAIVNLKEKFLNDAVDLMDTVQKSKDIEDKDKIYIINSLFKFCKEIDIDFTDYTELKKLQVFINTIEKFDQKISCFKKIYRIFKHTLIITFNTLILLLVSFVTIGLCYKLYDNTLHDYRKYLYYGYDFIEDVLVGFIFFSYITITNAKFWYDTMNYIIRNSLFNNLKSLYKEICSLFNIKHKIKIPKDAEEWFNNINYNTAKTLNKIEETIFVKDIKLSIKSKMKSKRSRRPKRSRRSKKSTKKY